MDSVPEPIQCVGEGPPCTHLLDDPESVLNDEQRWPSHICGSPFLVEGTRRWADEAVKFAPDFMWPIDRDDHEKIIYSYHDFALWRWRLEWPLPIGQKAVLRAQEKFGADYYGPGYVALLNAVPFKGEEEALWALRVHRNDNVLDLFGLARRTERETFTGGGLVFVLRGEDASLIDLISNAKRWWSKRKGLTIQGRPRGSGTWRSADEFRTRLHATAQKLRAKGIRPTQENIADYWQCDDALLRKWLRRYGIEWRDFLRTL